MNKQILSEEFRRMQKLAGIQTINEDISQEIQDLIDKNGRVQATPADTIEGNKFVLLFSQAAAKHIAERHLDGAKPGSLFKSGVNLRDVAKKILTMEPNEEKDGKVKWLGVDVGNVGEMGVAKASPEEVAKMKDYTMPDGGKEQVKIAPGKRKPTGEVSLVTFDIGTLSNGKTLLSVATMFPGGMTVDGTQIPMDRGEFASKGLYFVVDPSSALLKKVELKEVLDDLKDAQTAASWLKTQLDTYIKNKKGYLLGYQVEEQLEKLLKLVTKKFKIPENSFEIDGNDNTTYDEYDEGTTEGEIKLNGQIILTYSSYSDGYGDGYGFRVDTFNENALKAELEKLIKPTAESLEEIVNEALRKYRRQLNENEAAERKVYDYFYSDDIQRATSTSPKTCSEEDWKEMKNLIEKGKQIFLSQNPDITEQDFDKYYDEWLDYMEDEREMERLNR